MVDDKVIICPYCGLKIDLCAVTGRRDGYVHGGGYKGAFTCYRCTNVFKFDIGMQLKIHTERVPHQIIGGVAEDIRGIHRIDGGY